MPTYEYSVLCMPSGLLAQGMLIVHSVYAGHSALHTVPLGWTHGPDRTRLKIQLFKPLQMKVGGHAEEVNTRDM
jgi:hypothetical protein